MLTWGGGLLAACALGGALIAAARLRRRPAGPRRAKTRPTLGSVRDLVKSLSREVEESLSRQGSGAKYASVVDALAAPSPGADAPAPREAYSAAAAASDPDADVAERSQCARTADDAPRGLPPSPSACEAAPGSSPARPPWHTPHTPTRRVSRQQRLSAAARQSAAAADETGEHETTAPAAAAEEEDGQGVRPGVVGVVDAAHVELELEANVRLDLAAAADEAQAVRERQAEGGVGVAPAPGATGLVFSAHV